MRTLDNYFADVLPIAPLKQPGSERPMLLEIAEPDTILPADDNRRAAALAAFGLAYTGMSWREWAEPDDERRKRISV